MAPNNPENQITISAFKNCLFPNVKPAYRFNRFPQIPKEVLNNWHMLKGYTYMNADSNHKKEKKSVK